MRPGRKTMKSKIKYLVLLHIVLAVFSLTGVASKFAAGADFLSAKFIFCYGLVVAGLGIYAICWQQIIKHLPLITAYANKAVTVIWGLVFGLVVFGETITIRKVIGAAIIIVGVYFIVTADAIEEEKSNNSSIEQDELIKEE